MEHGLPERAAHALRGNGHAVDALAIAAYLSPLGWEHINLTGDYLWRSSAKIGAGSLRRYGLCNRLSACFIFRFRRRIPRSGLLRASDAVERGRDVAHGLLVVSGLRSGKQRS